MFGFLNKKTEINTTQIVDEIEAAVYEHVQPYGFKKHGRTLHRFVSEDISQLIHFQSGVRGLSGLMCVNIGIRIPECSERAFHPQAEKKKYYHDYECTIRSRLGSVRGKKDTWYDLHKKTEKITKSIIDEIDQYVLPAYEILNSRDAIIAHRKDYPSIDSFERHLILMDECMIYGHLGNTEKAKQQFEAYYQSAVNTYNNLMKKGRKQYLRKGERIVFMGQDITAQKDEYATIYGASHRHIDYLDELAVRLGFR